MLGIHFSGCLDLFESNRTLLIFLVVTFSLLLLKPSFTNWCVCSKTGKEELLQHKVLLSYTGITSSLIPQNKRVQISSVLVDLGV